MRPTQTRGSRTKRARGRGRGASSYVGVFYRFAISNAAGGFRSRDPFAGERALP